MNNSERYPASPILDALPRATAPIAEELAQIRSSRSKVLALALVLAGFLGASVDALASVQRLHVPTQAIWLYLPLVVCVTIRWGLLRGLLLASVSTLYVLWFLVAPLGRPFISDPMAVALMVTACGGMFAMALTVAKLTHHRLAMERRGRAEAESLENIGQRISASLELQDVLVASAESAHRLVRADVTSVALIHGPQAVKIAAVVGNRTPFLEGVFIPAGEDQLSKMLKTTLPRQTRWNDPLVESQSQSCLPGVIASEGIVYTLSVPITRAREVVGLLWVHSRTTRKFTDAEISLLVRLAAHSGVAIANAQAHAAEQQGRAEVEALLTATAKLSVQTDPDAVLRTLAEQATVLTDAERAAFVVRPDPAASTLSPEGDNANRTMDLTAEAVSAARHRRHSLLSVPLLGPEQQRLGAITLANSRRAGGFNARDERLVAAICETGSAVLLRAQEVARRLLAEQAAGRRKQEVEALLTAADRLNSAVEGDEVLREVLDLTAELLDVERAEIVTSDGAFGRRCYTLENGVRRTDDGLMPLEGSLAGLVIQGGKPYRTSDLADCIAPLHPSWARPALSRALCVPIASTPGHVLASLQLFDRRDGSDFSDDDLRLAEGIAHQAAVALERVRLQEQLRHQAFSDALTGLANRARFLDRLVAALDAMAGMDRGVGVLFVDLDGFKVVNDSLGHPVGDALLKAVGDRFAALQGARHTVARFGGDEFAILLEDIADPDEALAIAGRVLEDLSRPFNLVRHQRVFLTASIGIAFRTSAGPMVSAEDLLREADIALYQAKGAGKARAMVFADTMGRRASERLELQTDLQHAAERGEFRLDYQPIVEFETQQLVGAEALLRWKHPRRGWLSPSAFIPTAEETGLILPIGLWALEEACRQAAQWRPTGSDDAKFRMSVNLSPLQLEPDDLVEQVSRILQETGLDPTVLQLEITETAVMRQSESALAKLAALKELGVHLALDDFGTGYSSLSYLQRLPVDALKIDQSFVQSLSSGNSAAAIVRAVITLAHALGMVVTAEGIESADQATFLSGLGCDQAQGFYFSRPGPAEGVTYLLGNRRQARAVPRTVA